MARAATEERRNLDRNRFSVGFIHGHASHFSLFEVIYNNYKTQRSSQFDKIASIQYSILLLLFLITQLLVISFQIIAGT